MADERQHVLAKHAVDRLAVIGAEEALIDRVLRERHIWGKPSKLVEQATAQPLDLLRGRAGGPS